MKATLRGCLAAIVLMFAWPTLALAQEAAVRGTVTDETGGVLPGVTVTAQNEATGNTVVVATDGGGVFRIPVRVGQYRIIAELQGFAAVTRTGVQLLLGQEAVVNLQMRPSALQETVTVTGEAPLIDVTNSTLSGNIDPRQMSEIPVNGRNWVDLVMLAPGSRSNAVETSPIPSRQALGAFHLNVDGQQYTSILSHATSSQARFSRDAIAEFEFVSNRFDASQGRSSGVHVNAITKSGTNALSGSFSGYFRDDRFNAADFVQQRVLPYSNQQLSATFGGPIVRNRIHYFANYEVEREPQTATFNSPYPIFNIDLKGKREEKMAGARLDFELPAQLRLAVRGTLWRNDVPNHPRFTGGATFHPSRTLHSDEDSDQLLVTLTKVVGNHGVNEFRAGYASVRRTYKPYVRNPLSYDTYLPGIGAPLVVLRGYQIGSATNTPQFNNQENFQFKNDLTYTFEGAGRHTMKLGAEYLFHRNSLYWCNICNGTLDATGGPPPANLQELFPVWDDATTWNLAPLASISRTWRQGFGDMFIPTLRDVYAFYAQDDWAMTPRLTLNLGVRYDLLIGALGERFSLEPFVPAGRTADKNNIQPRLGFGYSLNDRTIVRGGSGIYYAEIANNVDHWIQAWGPKQAQTEVLYDGRADFAVNPFNGPTPALEEARQRLCSASSAPDCLREQISSQLINPHAQVPFSYQTSIGFQQQVASDMSVQADYVYTAGRHEFRAQNLNLSYNPDTGANYRFTDISRRPYPNYGYVGMDFTEGWSNYHGIQTAFTKRFSNRWQAAGTYTLSWLKHGDPGPLTVDLRPGATFPLQADLGEQYSYAESDQRHRAVVNGVWEAGYGFQVSGLYFFGSGERFGTTYGADLRASGGRDGRLRPDGTIVPRNSLVGKSLHRVDLRIQRRFPLIGSARIDGILEVFNLFNHENYGSYVTQESNRNYGRPTRNLNVAYQPRMLQLGFRLTF